MNCSAWRCRSKKNLRQGHRSQTVSHVQNGQDADRRDGSRVMSLFTSPHGPPGPACGFDLPPKPPSRRPTPNSSTAPVSVPPPSSAAPPPTAGSTSDGFRVFLAAHADEVPDPSSWTPLDPLQAFNGCPALCRNSPHIPIPPTTRGPYSSGRRYPLHPPRG